MSEKQADLLFAAREDCERLQTIVDEFLNVSRASTEASALARTSVDPEELVRATIESHRRLAEERRVRLVAEALPGLPHLDADRERVLVALDNLVVNAVRFSPESGRVIVRVRGIYP